MELITYFLFLILIYPINQFFNRSNLLPNRTGDIHQKFINKEIVPLTGGLFILITIFIIFKFDLVLNIFFLFFFILGVASDKKYIFSPKIKFLLQVLLVIFFVLIFDLKIQDLRNAFLFTLLQNQFISYIFIVLCLLVLINGSNFIDGLNGLQLGYYFMIILILFKNNFLFDFGLNLSNSLMLISLMFYLIILNFKNKLFLGDNGSYVLSMLIAYILVQIYNNNSNISPFFIALLLWYPCFENLFSIIRKSNFNFSPLKPDSKHLHQLIFIYLKRKNKTSNIAANNSSSLLINLVNFIIIFLGSLKYNHSIIQILLIILMSTLYVKIYLTLYNKISKIKL